MGNRAFKKEKKKLKEELIARVGGNAPDIKSAYGYFKKKKKQEKGRGGWVYCNRLIIFYVSSCSL